MIFVLRFPVNLSGDRILPNIKRWEFSTAHMPGVEGMVGEGESFSWGGARTNGDVHKRKLNNEMFLHSDFLTSLSSSLTPLFLTIIKLVLQTNDMKR